MHTLDALAEVFGSERFACVARELTKQYEDIFQGNLGDLAELVRANENRRKGEFVLLVAGAGEKEQTGLPDEVQHLLQILVAELPLKQAASIAAKVTGLKKNKLYQAGLKLR